MTKTLMFSIFASLMLAATAQARPATYKMTCQKAANLVASRGEVVLSTSAYTYDRFVAHAGYCGLGETTRPAFVPTRDVANCFVGYTCSQDNRGGGNGG